MVSERDYIVTMIAPEGYEVKVTWYSSDDDPETVEEKAGRLYHDCRVLSVEERVS